MGLRSTRAVVSRTLRMSNSSKLVSLVSERHGLVKVMAKGARRPLSKYGAALEPVTVIEAMYYYKDSREIQTLSDASLEKPYLAIKADLIRLPVASCMVELAQYHTTADDPGAGTFHLLESSLDDLEASHSGDETKHLWRYVLRLLAATGYEPSLDGCIECGRKTRGKAVFFSFASGGVVCSCTPTDDRYGVRVSAGALMVMKELASAPVEELHRIKLSRAQGDEVERTVLQFLAYHTGSSRPPRSLSFIRKMKSRSGDGQPPGI